MSDHPGIIGVETEYALAPSGPFAGAPPPATPPPFDRDVYHARAARLIDRVQMFNASLPGSRPGLFLANGSRVYDDLGHVEYCTPETTNPADALTHILAGERVLQQALNEQSGKASEENLALYNLNLDYGSQCSGWGCHENYSYIGDTSEIRSAVVSHLASRVIYTGAGGFDPHRPLRFVLSPRASLLPMARERSCIDALFHPRDSTDSGGGSNRLQVISGESLRSYTGTYLKLGSTALVVQMAQQGVQLGPEFQPLNALDSFVEFSRDHSLMKRTRCRRGDSQSALTIQLALMDLAEKANRAGILPDWANSVISLWRQTLTSLSHPSRRDIHWTLDWGIKWSLFDAHCKSNGTTLQRLLVWDQVLHILAGMIPQLVPLLSDPQAANAIITGTVRNECDELMGRSSSHRLFNWADLPIVLKLRLQLRELDWRYSQLGGGAFESLDRSGVLNHRLPMIADAAVRRAMFNPPRDTRARVRGRIIARWSGTPRAITARCFWDHVIDHADDRILRLDYPTPNRPRWTRLNQTEHDNDALFEEAIQLYRVSRFHESHAVLRRLRRRVNWAQADAREAHSYPFRLMRYSAWASARLGRFEAIRYLSQIHGSEVDASCELKVGDYLYCYRFLGSIPNPGIEPWLVPARELMNAEQPGEHPQLALVRENVAAWHLHRGELDEAEQVMGNATRETCTWRRVRIHCLLAEIERRRGRVTAAHTWLESARNAAGSNNEILIAEQIIPVTARLTADRADRAQILEFGIDKLRGAQHRMALAELLTLKSELCTDLLEWKDIHAEIGRLKRVAPALRDHRGRDSILARNTSISS